MSSKSHEKTATADPVNDKTALHTQLQEAEHALAQLQLQARLLREWSGHAMIELDTDANIVEVNEAAERALQWSSDELVGKPYHATVHHTQRDGTEYPAPFCPPLISLADGIVHHCSEVFWGKDGSAVPVDYVCYPCRDTDQSIVGLIIAFHDLAEKKREEGKRVQTEKMESIGQLAAGLAHEINTPAQYVLDNLHFVQDSIRTLLDWGRDIEKIVEEKLTLPEEVREVLAARREEIEWEYLAEDLPQAVSESLEGLAKISEIVLAMKDFAHPGVGSRSLTDLNELIRSTTVVTRSEWSQIADLDLQLDPELPEIELYPADVSQVILNLILNAIQAVKEMLGEERTKKGIIQICSRPVENWAEIRVHDTGSGIPDEIAGRIYDPFFTTKDVGLGTGQGLSVAHSTIVDKHGGTLSHECPQEGGTVFIVRLPITQS